MKRLLLILLSLFVLVGCGESEEEKQLKIKLERESFIKDSIAQRELFILDSTVKAQKKQDSIKNAEYIKTNKKLFRIKKDEFSNQVWYFHKNTPQHIDVDGILIYFTLNNDKPYILRFRYQYEDDDWLFIKGMVFNIDGEIFNIVPSKMNTDHRDYIWEWFDTYVGSDKEGVSKRFIEKLANAKQAKVKLVGRYYEEVVNITPKQIKAIKETYDYYKALGGNFDYLTTLLK